MARRYRELSKKTSKAVGAWAFDSPQNENDPVAEAYRGACLGLASFNRRKVADRLGISMEAAAKIDLLAFEYRNAIARAIYKMLRETRQEGQQ